MLARYYPRPHVFPLFSVVATSFYILSENVSEPVNESEWKISLINLIGYFPIAANENLNSSDHCLDN